MRQLSQPFPKTFNLLSIGQRGVGKTVFLAGSYAQLQANTTEAAVLTPALAGATVLSKLGLKTQTSLDQASSLWFECQDDEVQTNLEKILHHIERTGTYPPATIKITDFNFRLQQQTSQGAETLCNFRWFDIPGEACNLRNAEFQEIVITSHACCVFISAPALLRDPSYAPTLQDILNQVVAIASLVEQHRLNYAISLILTQCDLLEPGDTFQIEANLQPLLERLRDFRANYRLFYSAIPIETIAGRPTLKAKGAADPLLWLLAELNRAHRFHAPRSLASELSQPRIQSPRFTPRVGRLLMVSAITGVSLLGICIFLLFELNLIRTAPKSLPPQEQRSP